jgi:hypothetical protein
MTDPNGPEPPGPRRYPAFDFGESEELVDLDTVEESESAQLLRRPGGLFEPRRPGAARPGAARPGGFGPRRPPWAGEDQEGEEPDSAPEENRLVRLYTLTGGRTRPSKGTDLDLIAQISLVEGDHRQGFADDLTPEHQTILDLVLDGPLSVAEIAAHADLPVGITRILLGDLLGWELIRVNRPVPPALLPDERILREVINGLRAL